MGLILPLKRMDGCVLKSVCFIYVLQVTYSVCKNWGRKFVDDTKAKNAVINGAASVRHDLQYVRQCGKSRDSVCKTCQSLKPTR